MTPTSVVGKKSKYIESQEHYQDEVKGEKKYMKHPIIWLVS